MTIRLSQKTGGGSAKRLAPNTAFPANATYAGGAAPYIETTGVDISTGADVINLSGKYVISAFEVDSITASTALDVVLTVDGVTIWNDTIPSGKVFAQMDLWGTMAGSDSLDPILCESTFVLNLTQVGETTATIKYIAAEIL